MEAKIEDLWDNFELFGRFDFLWHRWAMTSKSSFFSSSSARLLFFNNVCLTINHQYLLTLLLLLPPPLEKAKGLRKKERKKEKLTKIMKGQKNISLHIFFWKKLIILRPKVKYLVKIICPELIFYPGSKLRSQRRHHRTTQLIVAKVTDWGQVSNISLGQPDQRSRKIN